MIPSTITASYGGASASAVLTVFPFLATVATANFGVSGVSLTDTCALTDNGATLECTFDGSTSTAPGTIVAWDWTYGTSAGIVTRTTGVPVLTLPKVSCAFVPPPPLQNGATSFPLTVTLRIHDSLGNVSAVAVDSSARVMPQGSCGF
jgi:hypothetical protein